VGAQPVQRRRVRRIEIRGNVDLLGLAPDRRRYRARSDDDDVDAEWQKFAPQALGQTFEREFRGGLGREERNGVSPAHRADVDDAAGNAPELPIGTDKRRESFGGDDHADQVDFDLVAELFDRQFQQRAGDGDAGIVDEAGECLAGERGAHIGRRRVHRCLIGDVENQRHEAVAELRREPLGVGRFAHAAENPGSRWR